MCGIVGIFAYSALAPPVDRGELLRIRDAMINRGPDGAGEWISPDNRVGLAHRRLAIIDLSEAGAQPMATVDGRLGITFNGEIYNYRELRRSLEEKGYLFRSNSDTEVLLHLYAEHGIEMLSKLRGMYAFALWDASKRGILLARDPLGIKPLYCCDDGNSIRIASQVKALLKGNAVDTTPDPAGHVGFFLWGHVPEPYTLYKKIRALPPGSSLWIDTSGNRVSRQFFNVTEELAKASGMAIVATREQMQERVRAALVDTVRHHMIADVPVGVFLSSGLDSTTIAALAQEIANTPVHTVTMGFREFRGGAEDEVPLAELVARQYGTVHHTHWVTKDDFRDEYDNVMQAMDQPSIDGINSYFVSKAAAEAGLKVALSGLGGDELFGGYPSFRQLPALVGALKPFKSIPFLGKGFRLLSAGTMRKFTSPKYAGLLEYGTSYGGAYLLRRGMYMPWELPEVLDGEMVRQGWDELRALSHLEQTIQDVRNVHLKVTALETSWYMRNQLLRDADWASMAHSLEVRVPLVDIELFRAMAPLFNLSHAPGKLTMAQAPIKALPSQILQRKKTGFTIPVAQWLTSSGRGVATRGLRNWAIIVSREFGGGGSDKSDESRPTVLIFRTGQLGDTLVALPAIATIRREYPNHRLILLTDRHSNSKEYVSSWEICKPAGWFDDVIFYDPGSRGWAAMAMWFSVVRGLRGINVHHFFNLAPGRTKWQSVRDAIIFKGLGRVVNYHPPVPLRSPKPDHKGALPWVEPEWQQTLRGIDADLAEDQAFKLPIPESDRQMARRVAQADGIDFGRKLLAFGPGSKMPAKIWPIGRFAELGERLQEEFPELQLVVLGGEEDVAKGNELCANWGRRSHNLAGRLSLYGSASVLEACTAYVGNDTGIMHLAAMAGTRCVAIFSARDFPGRWTPYGKGHVILRRDVQCGGCLLEVCTKYENKCLTLISVDEVHEATKQILAAASK